MNDVELKRNASLEEVEFIELYRSVEWGHAKCPRALLAAIANSSLVISAHVDGKLIGLGRAITDTTITVYFPDLLIMPQYQRQGIGTKIMTLLLEEYGSLHNQVLIAQDEAARAFYHKLGFKDEKFAMAILKNFPDESADKAR